MVWKKEFYRCFDVLDVPKEWIMINGKPKKIMPDNGKQFTDVLS